MIYRAMPYLKTKLKICHTNKTIGKYIDSLEMDMQNWYNNFLKGEGFFLEIRKYVFYLEK